MKRKNPAKSHSEPKSSGLKLVEKYRPRMSRLTDIERQKLMARGLKIYGDAPAAKPTRRGGTITLAPIQPRPSQREVSKVIKSTIKDYARTMKKLA